MQMHRNCHRNSNLIHCFYFNLKVFIQTPIPSHGNSVITYTYNRQEWKRAKVSKWLPPSQPLGIFWLHILKAPLWCIPFFNDPQEAALEANRLPECWSSVISFLLKDNPKFRLEAAVAYKTSMAGSWGNSKFSLHKWVPCINTTVPK